ncbi:MAG: AAA family ATPase [Rhodobacteraceae bacterium]|nr:AAA family ATPase [Paracoccaceae bacterium]
MILKGNQRANGRELALHLLNVEDNEHAVVHELRGFMSDDLIEAFKETEAISLGTKCQQYLFSLSLNPPKTAKVSVAEFERVIDEIERRMGLSGQPRAVVFHEKKGRRHAHCVWSRIEVEKMRAINLSHYKLRLRDISRELYLEHGWEMPAGLIDPQDRDPLNYSGAEASQAKRAKRDPAELKKLFKSCWSASDSRAAFASALREQGFSLARGDRRGFVAVDADGEVYSLSRWFDVKTEDLRARLGEFSELPSVEEAITLLNGQYSKPDNDRVHARQIVEYKSKVADLVLKQREERKTFSQKQETRRIAEIKARRTRLPTGIRAVWARLSGQYQRLCDTLASEAKAGESRDSLEAQALIERHLAERRALDRELSFLEAQQALEREFLDNANTAFRDIYQPDPLQPLVLPRDDVPFTAAQLKKKPELILAYISDKKSRFTRTDIMRGLSEFIHDPLELRVSSDRALASSELVQIAGITNEEFTTRDFLAAEQSLDNCAQEMATSGGFKISNQHIEKAIKRQNADMHTRFGANLSDEQVAAVHHILAPHQLASVIGLAGAGKSTLLATARVAWERQGNRVHGAALAGKASDSLQSASGIPSRTLASLEASWKSGYDPVAAGDILVIDEAGMVGTRQLERVIGQLQQRGCKVVLVGDPDQLQPIQAGKPFRDISKSSGTARLTEIRRQKSAWQREASRDLANGQTELALQTYTDQGAVHKASDRDQAIMALVDDYVADCEHNGPDTTRLAMAHRRIDVHAINQAIRTARNVSGLTKQETLFKTDNGPRAFANGDRILFTRNDKILGVRNGMLGTVTNVGDRQLSVRLDADDSGQSRALTFSPQQFPSIDHGFAVSIHRSQGCTVDKSYVLSSRTMDRNLTYVALTRHKHETKFYTAPDITPKHLRSEPELFAPRDFRARAPVRRR